MRFAPALAGGIHRLSRRLDSREPGVFGSLPLLDDPDITQVAEFYLRGHDAVLTVPAAARRSVRIQVYWRIRNSPPDWVDFACEQIISAQTHLLTTESALVHESFVPDAGIIGDSQDWLVTSEFGFYGQWPHPAAETTAPSVQTVLKSSGNGVHLRRRLFGQSLEKGVILRARILHVWSKTPPQPDIVREFRQEYDRSDPVLTT